MICPSCKQETSDIKLICEKCGKYCQAERVKLIINAAKKAEIEKDFSKAIKYYTGSLKLISENNKVRVSLIQKIDELKKNTESLNRSNQIEKLKQITDKSQQENIENDLPPPAATRAKTILLHRK